MLADVLARLPDDHREVIILRNLEGLPHEEIAWRMGFIDDGQLEALAGRKENASISGYLRGLKQ